MPRKSISGFAEAGAAMAQQLDDNDLLNLFIAIGGVVSKRPAFAGLASCEDSVIRQTSQRQQYADTRAST